MNQLDRIRGCLLAGAAGDALGAAVEFMDWPSIRQKFGDGIPAILITADRSLQVRDTARAEGIVVLNKPVKPAALRALLGQWRAQQTVAAE